MENEEKINEQIEDIEETNGYELEQSLIEESIINGTDAVEDDYQVLDPVKLYLKEIVEYPLLTDEEVKNCYENLTEKSFQKLNTCQTNHYILMLP